MAYPKLNIGIQFFKTLLFNIWKVFAPDSKHIFIMAHMRSGSSLLEHILASNPEIIGVGEQSKIYNSYNDLRRGELFTKRNNNYTFKSIRYVTDQVLHQKYTPNISLIRKNAIKVVFLIRNPEETLSSIEKFGGPYGINEKNEFNSIDYYKNRLTFLTNLSQQIPKEQQIFLTYKDLGFDTEKTLSKLSSFLGLRTMLKKEYTLRKTTGRIGDTSKNIKEGKIILTNKSPININSTNKVKINELYQETLDFFKNI